MDDLRDLQAKVRALELSGNYQDALELYQSYLENDGDGSRAGLWAQAGSLQLRMGHTEQAVESYARAMDLYAAEGRRNVALALCQRLLRADPSLPELYLRFGELSAALGYARDARHGYVEFATRAEQAGDPLAAASALRAYLQRFPDDAAVRRRLRDLVGDEAAAEAPHAAADAAPAGGEGEGIGLLPTLDEPSAPPTQEESGETGDESPLVPTAPPEASAEGAHVAPLEGFEPTHTGAWAEGEGAAPELLPLIGSELPGPDEPPTLPPPEDAREETADDDLLPLLAPEALEHAPEAATPADRLRARVAEDPSDRKAWAELVRLLEEEGSAPELMSTLDAAHRALAAAGHYGDAADHAAHLGSLRPDDVPLHRQRVDHASRSGDRARLVDALLALGRCCEADLRRDEARGLFERVLELDPGNADARQALASVAPAARPSQDYVDLGALILSDDPGDASTRFQVDAEQPSGDEERDLADILDLFRQKVSESIDPKDAASHYDLGLAFKEMGLFDDAIAQLQRALRGGSSPLATLEVLGECFLEKGEYALAARILDRATKMHNVAEADLVGVYYWLGRSLQSLGDEREARSWYERVVAVDIGFRDSAARLEALRSA